MCFYALRIKEKSNQRRLYEKDVLLPTFQQLFSAGLYLNWHLNRIDKAERADKFILAHCHPNRLSALKYTLTHEPLNHLRREEKKMQQTSGSAYLNLHNT